MTMLCPQLPIPMQRTQRGDPGPGLTQDGMQLLLHTLRSLDSRVWSNCRVSPTLFLYPFVGWGTRYVYGATTLSQTHNEPRTQTLSVLHRAFFHIYVRFQPATCESTAVWAECGGALQAAMAGLLKRRLTMLGPGHRMATRLQILPRIPGPRRRRFSSPRR
jgi:hypothetical protein